MTKQKYNYSDKSIDGGDEETIATNHVVRHIAIAVGTDRQAVTCIISYTFFQIFF
jgi:hypothetical protein